MNGCESVLDCVMHLQSFNGTWRIVYWTSVMNFHSHISTIFYFILTIFKAHTNHLQRVFNILTEHEIKVNAKKCKLFQKKINYLGRTITDKGYGIHKNNTDLSQICHRFGPYNIFQTLVNFEESSDC